MASPLIAYCGLYCGACSFQTAYETSNKKHIENLPSIYDKYKTMELENCPGCRLENKCGECKIRDCAIEKKIDYCLQCPEYPCVLINSFVNDGKPHHKEVVNNFKLLKELGEENWLKEMKKKNECPNCKTRYSWYFSECECHK